MKCPPTKIILAMGLDDTDILSILQYGIYPKIQMADMLKELSSQIVNIYIYILAAHSLDILSQALSDGGR